jgi:hypothetical protein
MLIIHYPTSFRALDEFISGYNLNVSKHSEKIRAGAILTARELIRIYGVSLLKASAFNGFDRTNLPSLQTNNQQLAELVKCSSRSIQRYIKKLLSAGIITSKKFRGSNANYELWIKPEIIALGEQTGVEKSKANLTAALEKAREKEEKEEESGIYLDKRPCCPHSYSGNFKNNLIIAVETVDNHQNCQNSGNTTGNTRIIAYKKNVSGEEKKGSAAAAPPTEETRIIASQVDKSGSANLQIPDPTCDNFQNFYVRLFWMMARNLLYKDKYLTDSQVEIAQKLIFKFYAPVKKEHIDGIHKIYIERLSLVAKYLAKDPARRFVPLPYIYFDTANPKGFVGTKKWYKEHKKNKKDLKLELVLNEAINKFTGNEMQEPINRNPPLTVFRECQNTLVRFGDPSLLDRFHAAVLEHQAYPKIIH